ncbi:MAG TPA: LysM domain-containing protein, partial [Chroococcales cyanobacterium]
MADLNVSGAPRATAPLQAPRANQNPVEIKIKPGDTLSQLAKRYGVGVEDFQRPDGKEIENKDLIYAGETLVLPAKAEAPKAAETAKIAKTAPLQTDT